MKKLKEYKWFILAIVVIVAYFCWFQIRPAQIRKKCVNEASEKATNKIKTLIDLPGAYEAGYGQEELEEKYNAGFYLKKDYDNYYETCLNKNGLK